MKTNFYRVYLILTILLFLKTGNNTYHKKIVIKYQTYKFEDKYNDSIKIYNQCISKIKESEGFMSKVYICPAGYRTIGYGHKLLNGESFKSIDTTKAIKILKEDFNKGLKQINKKYKDSSYNWKLAHAHATYCLGFSKVIKAIKNKNLHKYVFYKKNNKYVKAKSLINARQFELGLINKV